jgi:arsenate reductase (thioredoxin)
MVKIWLQKTENQLSENPVNRHENDLEALAKWIVEQHSKGERAQLNFICTHNSRRSQFAQAWCRFVQDYLGLDIADSYSGGTEETACNERTIAALKRSGFSVKAEGDENPVYTLSDEELPSRLQLWSKVFDDASNPSETFAAVMTCDHADQNCPFIPGAAIRVSLTYTDPKYADGTAAEENAYDKTCRMIATDMLRLFKQVQKKLNE